MKPTPVTTTPQCPCTFTATTMSAPSAPVRRTSSSYQLSDQSVFFFNLFSYLISFASFSFFLCVFLPKIFFSFRTNSFVTPLGMYRSGILFLFATFQN